MMTVKVKMCGLRSRQDVQACAGADAMGVVVLADSPRCLSLAVAEGVLESVPPGMVRVAVTTCSKPAQLRQIVTQLAPDAIQVHRELPPRLWREIHAAVGDETPVYGLLGVRPAAKLEILLMHALALRVAPLTGVVLDTVLPTAAGGSGTTHDWGLSRRVREALYPVPVMLAGGLTPENVRQAVGAVAPDWVDVSSGVEEGGRKSPDKVQAFLRKAQHETE